jgi:hypothetical protein
VIYSLPLDLDPTVEIKLGELTEGIRVSRPSPARYGQMWMPATLPVVSGDDGVADEERGVAASSRMETIQTSSS